ncbi:putative membrane protein [Yersinia ruckeri]|nr:putative membrane protein [Yersinia ruckeri]
MLGLFHAKNVYIFFVITFLFSKDYLSFYR